MALTDTEIIRTLATKCMGWKVYLYEGSKSIGFGTPAGDRWFNPECESDGVKYWNPLSSISDAFQVVEKMGGLDLIKVDEGWMVGDGSNGFSNDNGVVEMKLRNFAIAPTICRAICLAAIAALEGK